MKTKKYLIFWAMIIFGLAGATELFSYIAFKYIANRTEHSTEAFKIPYFGGKSLTGRPRNGTVHFKSGSVSIAYSTNDLGFRDHNHDLKKPENTIRVAILGDSFTEGWGVEQNANYASVLESLMNQKAGTHYEIFNFGLSHSGPGFAKDVFKEIAQKYQPDIVIFGSFTGNDFDDALRENAGVEDRSPIREHLAVIESLRKFPYSTHLLKFWYLSKVTRLEDELLLEGFKANKNFQALDEEFKTMALRREVHISMISMSINNPNALIESLNNINLEKQNAYEAHLLELSQAAEAAGVKTVIVLNIPNSVQVSKEQFAELKRMGFKLDESLLTNRNPQKILSGIVERVNTKISHPIIFKDLTPEFIEASKSKRIYLEYDGHINANGHAVIAKYLSEILSPNTQQASLQF